MRIAAKDTPRKALGYFGHVWKLRGSPGSLEVTATHSSKKGCTLIMVINSGEGNQAQICTPSFHSTKENPSGSTAFPNGKGDQSDLQRGGNSRSAPDYQSKEMLEQPCIRKASVKHQLLKAEQDLMVQSPAITEGDSHTKALL